MPYTVAGLALRHCSNIRCCGLKKCHGLHGHIVTEDNLLHVKEAGQEGSASAWNDTGCSTSVRCKDSRRKLEVAILNASLSFAAESALVG